MVIMISLDIASFYVQYKDHMYTNFDSAEFKACRVREYT